VDPEVGPVDGDERLAELVQGRLVALLHLRLDQHHPHAAVLESTERVDAPLAVADAPRGLAGHLDLGDQVAGRRIPAHEVDAGLLADQAATAVAADEVRRPQRSAVGQRDVDAGVVLGEARHFTPAVDRDRQLLDPGGEDALDALLPEREPVVVARRESR
jgi:hypothetical protein